MVEGDAAVGVASGVHGEAAVVIRDQCLLERLRTRERAACEAFVDAHYVSVYRFFHWLTNDSEASADLTQESFAAFWTSLTHLDGARVPDLKAWLYGIARNRWRKRCRSARTRDDWEGLSFERAAEAEDPAPGPEEIALAALDSRAVTQAVADLPPDYREALVLRVFQELSYAQVAETLGIEEGLARWRVHQARLRVRKALATAPVGEKAGV
jgi:RNA polymerase sigma-70 factor (ECF subfamily)